MAEFDVYGNCVYGEGFYKGVAAAPVVAQSVELYFGFLPNWISPVIMDYSFRTSISKSRKLKEQRKAAIDQARRQTSFRVLEWKDSPKIQMFLEENHARPIFLPVYTEPIVVSAPDNLQGQNVLTTGDLSQYFNLDQFTDYIIIIDGLGELDAEVIELSSYTANEVTLAANITGAYTRGRAHIYPAMYAFITGKKMIDETDTIVDYELTFREYY